MKDCVIVTSIVEITNAPVDWATVRSIYTHQQRFEQTLETIESIRTHLPNTDIILAECSPDSEYMRELEKRVDVFINTYPNDMIRNGYRKSVCEAQLMLYVFDRVDLTAYKNIFKMTGRYKLTEKFNKDLWMNDSPTACLTDWYSSANHPPPQIHPFFYKVTSNELSNIKKELNTMVSTNTDTPIEYILYNQLKTILNNVSEIGIEVRWACHDCIRQA